MTGILAENADYQRKMREKLLEIGESVAEAEKQQPVPVVRPRTSPRPA
jgi:hypothetical protein